MLIRITNLNYEIEIFNHLIEETEILVAWNSTGLVTNWANREVGEVGVQAHVRVQQRDLEQREDDQDEDEVD